MTKQATTERDESITRLREWIKPGDTVYTVLEHVSRSGMQREIRVLLARTADDGRIYFIHPNHAIGKALGYRQGKRDGLIVGGCGKDMGFHIVYSLSRVLFPEGFGIEGEYPNGSKGRPKSPEMAAGAVKAGAKFHGRNGDTSGWDNDGGYALHHEWL